MSVQMIPRPSFPEEFNETAFDPLDSEERPAVETPAKSALSELKQIAETADTPKKLIAALGNGSGPLSKPLEKAFGFQGTSFAVQLFSDNSEFFCSAPNYSQDDKNLALFAGLEAIIALAPNGPMQSMLAVQMLSVHMAAIKTMRQASLVDPEFTEICINRSTKLMRLFAQQAELMARLQAKITQQRIIVEKVKVNEGGQAIVGAIGPGSGAGSE